MQTQLPLDGLEAQRLVSGPASLGIRQIPSAAASSANDIQETAGQRLGTERTDWHGIPGLTLSAAYSTDLGALIVSDCLSILTHLPDETLDLVITSPPYDGQPKYGNGERYGRDWYEGFFLKVTHQVLRTLKPHGSFILNYRSKRQGDERGTLQYELVFRLRDQGFLFCDDFNDDVYGRHFRTTCYRKGAHWLGEVIEEVPQRSPRIDWDAKTGL